MGKLCAIQKTKWGELILQEHRQQQSTDKIGSEWCKADQLKSKWFEFIKLHWVLSLLKVYKVSNGSCIKCLIKKLGRSISNSGPNFKKNF